MSLSMKLEDPRDHSQEPGRTYECETVCIETVRLIAGCLGVCLLTFGYASFGGFMFMMVENRLHSQPDQSVGDATTAALSIDLPSNVDKLREDTVSRLWHVTEKMNILYPENWTRMAAEELLSFQMNLTQALTKQFMEQKRHSVPDDGPGDDPYVIEPKAELQSAASLEWTFPMGLLYSVSLLTTVGKLILV